VTDRILLTGGGTAGHINPALATAEALAELRPDIDVEFVGTADRLEARLVPEAGWPFHAVRSAPLRGGAQVAKLKVPFTVTSAAWTVRRLLKERDAIAACIFGGYTSGPLALGARLAGVPLVIHEQNAVPGLANRLAARWAHSVGVTVEAGRPHFAKVSEVAVTGNPVRGSVAAAARDADRAAARTAFGLDPDLPTLLVFGGSLGARRLNDAVLQAAGAWPAPDQVQILHAAGHADYARVSEAWAQISNVRGVCVEYLERMDLAYAAADLALCRAGASTLAELTLVGLPALLVPYPHAVADEQTANAKVLAEEGAAALIADHELDGQRLVALAAPLLADVTRLETMGAAASALSREDAAQRVARLVLAAAGHTPDDPY